MLSQKEIETMLSKAERKLKKAIAKKGLYQRNKLFQSELVHIKGQIKRLEVQTKLMKVILDERKPSFEEVMANIIIEGILFAEMVNAVEAMAREDKTND